MFGMGFTEILFIAVIAIIFLGPDKLPEAMIQIAKFFNSFKKTVSEAKSTFENEIHINELREEALSYKRTINNDISGFKNSLSNPIDDLNEALAELDEKKADESYKQSQKAPEAQKLQESIEESSEEEVPKEKASKKESQRKKKKKTDKGEDH